MRTTGDLRAELAKCFVLARAGKLEGEALRGVIGCSKQINTSIEVEIKHRAQLTKSGKALSEFGSLQIGSASRAQK
ncbi:MAG: hypothetical protein AB3X44_16140 [Leptothrix sp. (in: b-proteobacteria)]